MANRKARLNNKCLFVCVSAFLLIPQPSYPQTESGDVFSTTENPYKAEIDGESPVSFVVGENGDEKTSTDKNGDVMGVSYKAQKYQNTGDIFKNDEFPSLGLPYTIQTKKQEEAEKQGY